MKEVTEGEGGRTCTESDFPKAFVVLCIYLAKEKGQSQVGKETGRFTKVYLRLVVGSSVNFLFDDF